METRIRAVAWCVLAVMLACYLTVLTKNSSINIDSNILSLLPATEADAAVEQAFNNFSEKSMRRLVFLVVNTNMAKARQDAEELTRVLRESPWLTEVKLEHHDGEKAASGEYFFNYRHHLLSKADEALLRERNYQAFSEDAIRQAYAPFSGALIDLLQKDPFLLSYRAGMASSTNSNLTMKLDDGYLITQVKDDYYVLLTAELVQSPFNQDLQQQVLAAINGIEKHWIDESAGTRLIRAGALFYTAYAYDTARHEVNLIGGISTLLVLILLLLSFSSVRPVALVMVALGFGIASGFASVRIIFGAVHLLTIVFGTSLIGVAVDYSFHYFVIDDAESGETRLKRILPAINLGLLTSAIGYAALLPTPFPGLQQMALFCISGLIGAYLTVVLLFPIIPLQNKNAPYLLSLCQKFIALGESKSARISLSIALLLPIFALGMIIMNESTADDVRNFQAQNTDLLNQEHRIQSILNAPAANQFYLVKGSNPEELLRNLETAQVKLDALVAKGAINGYLSIADWLPSIRQQDLNYALYKKLYESDAGLSLIEAGLISQDNFNRAREALAQEHDDYLQPQTWLDSPLGKELDHLWLGVNILNSEGEGRVGDIERNQSYSAVIALRGVMRLDLLDNFSIGESGQAVFIDKISTVNAMLAAYRSNMVLLLVIVCCTVSIILFLRYGLKRAALILTSPIIAISTIVHGLVLLDEPLNLFHILSLFLVVGISVDFGIFSAEAGKLSANTLLAVLLSALSTIFSFGLLSLSATLAVHSFGLSTLIGISSALVLSPIIGHLVIKQSGETNDPCKAG